MSCSPIFRDDEALLRATQDGDADAFAEFYRRHRGPLLAYLSRQVDRGEVAADLMAESFAAALAAVHGGQVPCGANALAWLVTIARNKLIDSLRRGMVESA